MVHLTIPTRLHGRSKSNTPKNSSPPSRVNSPKPMGVTDCSLILKAAVLKGRNLAPKDRNGFSDPYVVLSLSDYRFTTETIYKTLDPTWNDTFDMALNGVSNLTLNCVCWDKDRFGKDYMGEFSLSLGEIFINGKMQQEPQWYPLRSTRKNSKISGEIQLQLSVVDGIHPDLPEDQLYKKWTQFLHSLTGAPSLDDEEASARGLNELETSTVYAENDETSDEGDESKSDDSTRRDKKTTKEKLKKVGKLSKLRQVELLHGSDVVGVIFMEISHITDLPPEHNMTRTGFDMDPFVVISLGKKTYRTKHVRHCLNPVYDEKMVFQVLRHEQNYQLNFVVIDRDKLSGNDYVADASLSLREVIAMQPSKNAVTGLYILPEPSKAESPSSGNGNGSKSRFRLPISRTSSGSSLASKKTRPELTHSTSSSSLQTTGGNGLEIRIDTGLDAPVPQPSPTKIVPAMNDSTDSDMKPFTLNLSLKNKDRWEDKHKPELFIKAKYVPYPALRQQFWRCILRQYDTDDSGQISRIELTTMLDSIGSTLSSQTIDGFFKRFMKENGTDSLEATELTMDQAVLCLEDQLNALSQRQSSLRGKLPHLSLPTIGGTSGDERSGTSTPIEAPMTDNSSSVSLSKSTQSVPPLGPVGEDGTLLTVNDELADPEDKSEEHVIQIKECPLCHQPRLNKRNDVDIITHLATCASADWRQVDNLVMGGFVTSSQAQRKWYSKIINKVSYGGYKLGANSANILVQDRITGQIQEERMSVYVRLGIRLLYKGLKSSSLENKKIRKLLHSLSVKQGKKFDSPLSVREIKPFIEFHQLDIAEVLLPLDRFKSFNEFFYRALKPGARPCSAPDNPKIIVSPADCRSVVFNKVDDATKVWIKGREFSLKRLLGNAYPEDAKLFENGALGIFRLAPQDYHRFHIPVDGILGEPKLIKGEYYTVNPMAIRSALDVYGENVRVCVPIQSPEFGRVMVICVGAMMVGSTIITAKEGQGVSRTDELGYFQFGGSTIVVLFEPGRMLWDDDLVQNSSEALETLIRVGMSVGHAPDVEPPSERKANVSKEDIQDAQRRIGGSLAPRAP